MKIDSPALFSEYTCYLIFHEGMGRWQISLWNPITNHRRTILRSKFLMSVHVGRMLEPHEEVDHIDGNKLNDSLPNLRIVSGTENRKFQKPRIEKGIITLKCYLCGTTFDREQRDFSSRKSKKIFCSKDCVKKYQKITSAIL